MSDDQDSTGEPAVFGRARGLSRMISLQPRGEEWLVNGDGIFRDVVMPSWGDAERLACRLAARFAEDGDAVEIRICRQGGVTRFIVAHANADV